MENNEVLLRAVETITDKPVTYTVQIANPGSLPMSIVDRLLVFAGLKKRPVPETERTFTLRGLLCGNVERIGTKAISIPEDFLKTSSISKLVVEGSALHMDDYLYVAAVGIQNDRHEPSRELIDFLRWNCTNTDIFKLCDLVLSKADYQSFLNTTVLIKGADVLSVPETDASNAAAPVEEKTGL